MVRYDVGRRLLATLWLGLSVGTAIGITAQTPNSVSIDGWTPLHESIRRNDLAAVKALIARRAARQKCNAVNPPPSTRTLGAPIARSLSLGSRADFKSDDYSWSTGRVNVPRSPLHVNYFLGRPT